MPWMILAGAIFAVGLNFAMYYVLGVDAWDCIFMQLNLGERAVFWLILWTTILLVHLCIKKFDAD